MKDLRVHKLDDFQKGKWVLGYTEAGGTVPLITKTDVIDVSYPPSSLVLFDDRGTIVGPVSVEAVRSLAERILEGDSRAATDPKTLLTLAVAVHGFLLPPDNTEAAASALEQEAAHV